MRYFHIPDGCYFNYTELLDFVLWIYMFFSSSVDVNGGILRRLLSYSWSPPVSAKAWKTILNYTVHERAVFETKAVL